MPARAPVNPIQKPVRLWWARSGELCALERPGGGGRSQRPARRAAEMEWLRSAGVRLVVSTMATAEDRHACERAGMEWLHFPVACAPEGDEALERLLDLIAERSDEAGAVAVYADRWSDFPVAVCAAYLHRAHDMDLAAAMAAAERSGLDATPEAHALIGLPLQLATAPSHPPVLSLVAGPG